MDRIALPKSFFPSKSVAAQWAFDQFGPGEITEDGQRYLFAQTANPPAVNEVNPPADVEMEVFATGMWADREWTTADLDSMVANYAKLAASIKPPVKLGHDDKQILAQKDGQPALGWVAGLRRAGNKLVAKIADMPKAIKDLVSQGRYKRVSAEIYPFFEEHSAEQNLNSGAKGAVLAGLALLGADVPEVKTLEDLPRLLAMEGTVFSEVAPIVGCLTDQTHPRRERPMDEKDVKPGIDLAAMVAQLKQEMEQARLKHEQELAGHKQELSRLAAAEEKARSDKERSDAELRRTQAAQFVESRSQAANLKLPTPESRMWATFAFERLANTGALVTAEELSALKYSFAEGQAMHPVSALEVVTRLIDSLPDLSKFLKVQSEVTPPSDGEPTFEMAEQEIAQRERLDLTKRDDKLKVQRILWRERPHIFPKYGRRAE